MAYNQPAHCLKASRPPKNPVDTNLTGRFRPPVAVAMESPGFRAVAGPVSSGRPFLGENGFMSSINPLGNAGPVQRLVSNPVQKQVPADAPTQLPATDKLQLSGV